MVAVTVWVAEGSGVVVSVGLGVEITVGVGVTVATGCEQLRVCVVESTALPSTLMSV